MNIRSLTAAHQTTASFYRTTTEDPDSDRKSMNGTERKLGTWHEDSHQSEKLGPILDFLILGL